MWLLFPRYLQAILLTVHHTVFSVKMKKLLGKRLPFDNLLVSLPTGRGTGQQGPGEVPQRVQENIVQGVEECE